MASLPNMDDTSISPGQGFNFTPINFSYSASAKSEEPLPALKDEPIPISSDSDTLMGDEDLPDLDQLIQATQLKRVPSAFSQLTPSTITPDHPLSPPTTPAKFPIPNSSCPSTIPQTPTRGVRPSRGIYPTPPQTRKRAWSEQTYQQDDEHDSEAPPTPSRTPKRQRSYQEVIHAVQIIPAKRHRPDIPSAYARSSLSSAPHPISVNISRLSCFEAQRLSISIMGQVNWRAAAEHVACNRSARAYKKAVQQLLEDWQEELDKVGDTATDSVLVDDDE